MEIIPWYFHENPIIKTGVMILCAAWARDGDRDGDGDGDRMGMAGDYIEDQALSQGPLSQRHEREIIP